MYARINKTTNKVLELINNCSFVDKNDLRHARDVFKKWDATQFAKLDMYQVISEAKPEDTDDVYYTLKSLKVGDVFAPQTWEEHTRTVEQKNAVIEDKLNDMDSQDMSRSVEDLTNLLINEGVITQEQIDSNIPYFASKKKVKETERAKIIK